MICLTFTIQGSWTLLILIIVNCYIAGMFCNLIKYLCVQRQIVIVINNIFFWIWEFLNNTCYKEDHSSQMLKNWEILMLWNFLWEQRLVLLPHCNVPLYSNIFFRLSDWCHISQWVWCYPEVVEHQKGCHLLCSERNYICQ